MRAMAKFAAAGGSMRSKASSASEFCRCKQSEFLSRGEFNFLIKKTRCVRIDFSFITLRAHCWKFGRAQAASVNKKQRFIVLEIKFNVCAGQTLLEPLRRWFSLLVSAFKNSNIHADICQSPHALKQHPAALQIGNKITNVFPLS